MRTLGLRRLLTYHCYQVWVRHVMGRWEVCELPWVTLGAALVFGVTFHVGRQLFLPTSDN